MDELEKLIEEARETRAVELKSSLHWSDDTTKAKVVRAALALSNHRDGGFLLFGFAPLEDGSHRFVGMDDEDAASFDPDLVVAKVNAHATPHIRIEVIRRTFSGKKYVAIVVEQFQDVPTICARDFVVRGKVLLTAGRLYCRSRRVPESTQVQNADDLREILDLAIESGLARYTRLRRVEMQASGPSDEKLFDEQIEDLE